MTKTSSCSEPGLRPPGHLRRMAALRRKYRAEGLVGPFPRRGGRGRGRPVLLGGRLYPSAQAAERAIGYSRGAVCQAIRKGCRCNGMEVRWADAKVASDED